MGGILLEKIRDFILLFLSQFAGGPGPAENNLVRFGLPAVLWAILLYIAWSRQRDQDLPREKWLVWGFGLALVRELYMFGQMAYRVVGSGDVEANCQVVQPLEHGLAMAAMIVVAAAFLHYILKDPRSARTYLLSGLGITALVFVFTMWAWPRQLAAFPQIKFHQTWAAWLFHIPLSIYMAVAAYLLWLKKGWLRNVVATALTLYLFSELLLLLNYATARAYNTVICPIGNSLHILAIPLLGYVYLHEQSIEKKKADEALVAYRDHLEELVGDRTAELTAVNTQLKKEILDRTQAEQALEQITRRYELILQSAGEGICGINPQGQIIFANPAAARMLGYSAAELVDRPCYSIWHPNKSGANPHSQKECPIYQGYSQGLQRYGDDERFWRKDGTAFPVRYFSNPVVENDKLAGTVVVFQDITDRKRNETEIARRNASLATQNAVAAALSQTLEIEENLKTVLEMVQAEVKMDIGLIYLLSADGEQLQLHLLSGLPSGDQIKSFASPECACQKISRLALSRMNAVTGSPMDFLESFHTPCTEQADIHTLVSVPLASKGTAVGVMTLGTAQAAPLQNDQLELLTALGQQIGMAIENADLYQAAEDWAQELTRLHEASSDLMSSLDQEQVYKGIARQACWLLNCQRSFVIRWNDQPRQIELVASSGLNGNEQNIWLENLNNWGILSDLVRQGRTTAIQNLFPDTRPPAEQGEIPETYSALFVPIWRSASPQEFLILLDGSEARQWQPREMELIENLSNRAAVALMNARLHQQLEVAAALEERQRIAANMHDGLAQTLSLLGLRADSLQELFSEGSTSEIEAAVQEIQQTVANATLDVRRSIASLQEAPRPRRPLQSQLLELLEQLQTSPGPELCFDPGDTPAVFLSSKQLEQILPVIQEAVVNANRHAHARNVFIRLEAIEDHLRLTIEDDGRGFDLDLSQENQGHFGLSIMQARIARINGEFQIDTSPGKGTRILLSWEPKVHQNWLSKPSPVNSRFDLRELMTE